MVDQYPICEIDKQNNLLFDMYDIKFAFDRKKTKSTIAFTVLQY